MGLKPHNHPGHFRHLLRTAGIRPLKETLQGARKPGKVLEEGEVMFLLGIRNILLLYF